MKIAVVGLGYVGLPLSMQFARSCISVLGIDVDATKVQLLNNGQSYMKHIEQPAIAELLSSGKFSATTDFSLIKEVEAVIICVPTPLNKNRNRLGFWRWLAHAPGAGQWCVMRSIFTRTIRWETCEASGINPYFCAEA
jgi:3-hydroxyisobutyrate dehydrogenase-like beta-hydroxyacid dehydrogenase